MGEKTRIAARRRALAALFLAGALCGTSPTSAQPSGAFELGGDPVAGREIYQRHCASCHGPEGAGDGQEGRAFDTPPSDFTSIEVDAERFYLATRDGGMAVGLAATMPAFRYTLSDQEIRDVVAYLLRLAR